MIFVCAVLALGSIFCLTTAIGDLANPRLGAGRVSVWEGSGVVGNTLGLALYSSFALSSEGQGHVQSPSA